MFYSANNFHVLTVLWKNSFSRCLIMNINRYHMTCAVSVSTNYYADQLIEYMFVQVYKYGRVE